MRTPIGLFGRIYANIAFLHHHPQRDLLRREQINQLSPEALGFKTRNQVSFGLHSSFALVS